METIFKNFVSLGFNKVMGPSFSSSTDIAMRIVKKTFYLRKIPIS